MKRSVLLSCCLVVMGLLLVAPVSARRIATVTIEDFNDPAESQWVVQGSKFISEGYPQFGHVNSWPDGLYRREPEGQTLRSLGARAQFDRLGYNYLEFIPVQEGDDGDLVARGIPIPGRAESLDFWVWGSNYDYYMEIQLRDHRGIVHTLPAGNINYIGWKNLQVRIPTHIPQDVRYLPRLRGLELVKILMWTRPTERVDGFQIFIDHITVLTDLHEDPFDGEDLAEQERLQQLWDGAEGRNF
ncbi:flagellar filament outer layer protein FlaA [Spirochaeta africana]|uniref:Flagellar filament outer layer protein Flaa n=1 Tax=Spirochaeta africana (strain ATCC 700263 / DSM 8902 / Z-7692) TaxID=889378 RepID=H9UHB8_SPIAZ|nr:flagellar filament outer layer protein FlaA [Spirochaeta africana]AFG36911.1 Flagellar filament outer layer protein Flaa [Spirochaeta africana DSM 8902]